MSHNASHVIINVIGPLLDAPEVRENWTADQCTKVDQIKACSPDWTDEQFRYIQRRLAQAFCTGD